MKVPNIGESLSQQKDIQYSKNVTLNLNIPAVQKKYIGVLVRGSDRIVDNIELLPPGFQSSEDVERSIKLTKEYLTASEKKASTCIIFRRLRIKTICLK